MVIVLTNFFDYATGLKMISNKLENLFGQNLEIQMKARTISYGYSSLNSKSNRRNCYKNL